MQHPDICAPSTISTYPICKEYLQRCNLVKRALEAGQLWEKTLPTVALAWLERMQIVFPAAMLESVEKLGLQVADWKTESDRLAGQVAELEAAFRVAHDQYDKDVAEWQADAQQHNDWQYEACKVMAEQEHIIRDYRRRIDELESELGISEIADSVKPEIDKRERASLLKIVCAMAIEGYGYDPTDLKSGIPKEIESDIAKIGEQLGVETIRKFLKQAVNAHDKRNAS